MQRQQSLRLAGVLTLVALLMTGSALAQGPGPQAALGTAFTYQGHLNDTGGPVNDTCDLTFGLYDEAGSGEPPHRRHAPGHRGRERRSSQQRLL
jgi:hypothetical protein